MRARRVLAVALAFAAALAVFSATRGDERAAAGPPPGGVVRVASRHQHRRPGAAPPGRGAPRRTARGRPRRRAYLQKARESGDPSSTRAPTASSGAPSPRGPEDAAELAEAAALAAGRHDFREASRLARRARTLEPDSVGAYPILVDALVELGRYDEPPTHTPAPRRPAARPGRLTPRGVLPRAARRLARRRRRGVTLAYRRGRRRTRERRLRAEPARHARAEPRTASRRTAGLLRGARRRARLRPGRGGPRPAGGAHREPCGRHRALAPARGAAAAARVRDRTRRGRARRGPAARRRVIVAPRCASPAGATSHSCPRRRCCSRTQA